MNELPKLSEWWITGNFFDFAKKIDIQAKNFVNKTKIKHKNTTIVELLKYALGLTKIVIDI